MLVDLREHRISMDTILFLGTTVHLDRYMRYNFGTWRGEVELSRVLGWCQVVVRPGAFAGNILPIVQTAAPSRLDSFHP